MTSTPSIGRIVHFRVPRDKITNCAPIVPAIITQVFDPGTYVNLLVLRPFADPYHEGSVVFDDSDEAPTRTCFWPGKAPIQ